MNNLWTKTLNILEKDIGNVVFRTWFIDKIVPIGMNDTVLALKAANDMTKSIVTSQYLNNVHAALLEATSKDYKIIIDVDFDDDFISTLTLNKTPENPIPVSEYSSNVYFSSPLNNKFTFDNFVIGNSNQLAFSAAVAVADAPGKAYNPLFLYGNVGLGKTHLMHSIAHHILEKNPSAKIVYASCETFLNELITAIRENKTEAFRNKYRKVDALLIDDIQFIAKKEATQNEFFHTFNTIYECNSQIIISSDRPLKEIENLEERLRSRFGSGLIADIQTPDFETRVAILQRKANLENIDMPEDVLNFIAKTISSSIRELEGALTTVNAYAKLVTKSSENISVDIAKIALKDIIINTEKQELSIELIQNTVAEYFGVSAEKLREKIRSKEIVYPRHIAMYLCRKLLDCPLSDIGSSFGGRDHSTVINGYKNIEKKLENNANPGVTKNVADIEAILIKE